MKLVCYEITLSKDEYELFKSRIDFNQPIIPETIGMLIGRAKPVYIQDKEEK